MISLIICSRSIDLPLSLKENINETIGENYEVIVIDNSQNKYSIFSAYNEGARKAKGDVLCFMHEDIKYYTKDWGRKVALYFSKDDNLGLLGVGGCHSLGNYPSYWIDSPIVSTSFVKIRNGNIYREDNQFLFKEKSLVDAVACDGFWICLRASLFFNKISFDEIKYSGFHYYDMDICLQILSIDMKVCICNDIAIKHASEGVFNSEFYSNQMMFYNKWKNYFPIHRGIPDSMLETVDRLDSMCQYLYNLKIEIKKKEMSLVQIKKSKSYRIGKLITRPFSFLKKLF